MVGVLPIYGFGGQGKRTGKKPDCPENYLKKGSSAGPSASTLRYV
jgi:hypothetical protein